MTDTNQEPNTKVVRNSTQPLKKATCSSCAKEFPVSLLFDGRCLSCTRAEHEASQHEDATPDQKLSTVEAQKAEKQAIRAAIAQRKQEKRDALEIASKQKLENVVQRGSEDRKQLALRELARRQLAKDHLLPFVMRFNPTYQPGWVHKDICEQLEWFSEEVAAGNSPRLILCVPPRHGKLLADHTLVPTPNGWVTHGELRTGDTVYHPSGRPIRILGTSGKAEADYKVTFSDGSHVWCHGAHEWTLYSRSTKQNITIETKALLTSRTGKRALSSGGRHLYQLPVVSALEGAKVELPIEPYVLGAWLGDGSRGKPCISIASSDSGIADAIEALGYPISSVCVHKDTGVVTTYFSGPKPGNAGRLTRELQGSGLFGSEKFIPPVYQTAHIEDRLQLLAGLVDTDGYVEQNGRVRYTTCDEQLAADIYALARGLGFRPYQRSVPPTTSSSGIVGRRVVYVVGFQPTMPIPTVLPRKQIRRFAKQRRVGVVSVEHAPSGHVGHCIQVDSPDGLYVVGETLITTHNSEIASRSLPAWHLGKYPKHEVIACSYSSSLAMSFSRKVRGIVRDIAYENLFETRLDPDSQSAENWLTTSGGGYLAAGVGGPITGRGAHILVIDDPVKNRADAESEVQRQGIWDWYTSTAYTRLAPGGGVLLILTRWHDDDLAGRLIRLGASGMGDQWKIISYPAISEVDEIYRKEGEALHEARYPIEALNRIKRAVGPRDWSALYQQNPTASDGDLFKLDMIRFYNQEDLPPWDELNYYTCWDLAVGVKEQNDWTVGITIALDAQDNIYIVDVHRGRWDSLKTVETILDVFETYRATITGLEKGQIELAIGPLLLKRARERGLQGFSYYPLSTGRKDKVARSRPIQGRMLQGKVFFRSNDDRQATLINELLRFPNGVNDDQVDALSHHGILLDTLVAPRTVVITKPKKSWRDKLSQYTTSGRPKRSFMSC